MKNSTNLKFATYFVRGAILVFAFLVLGVFWAFFREIVKYIGAGVLPKGIFYAVFFVAAFSGMSLAWKLAKRIGTVKNEALKSKSGKIDGVIKCPSCNTYQHDKEAYCPNCGYNFSGSEKEKASTVESNEGQKGDIAKETLRQKRQSEKLPLNKTEEFPYMSELNRRIYADLLKEKKDEATMLQAKVECGEDKDRIETTYYKLRYAQIIESGNVDELKAAILAEKRKSRSLEQTKSPGDMKQKTQKQGDRFIAKASGVVKDTKTDLEWIAGLDMNITWNEAKEWVENLNIGGGGWRMPTIEELNTLYDRSAGTQHRTPLLKTSGKLVWSGERGESMAWAFNFDNGDKEWYAFSEESYDGPRVFAVRPRLSEKREGKISAQRERFILNPRGVLKDSKTGLEWIAGPDKDTTWHEAKDWVQSLGTDGGGWRMPTVEELRTLYNRTAGPQHMTPLLKTTGRTVWTGKIKGSSSAWNFGFYVGQKNVDDCEFSVNFRGFAVRSRSDG